MMGSGIDADFAAVGSAAANAAAAGVVIAAVCNLAHSACFRE